MLASWYPTRRAQWRCWTTWTASIRPSSLKWNCWTLKAFSRFSKSRWRLVTTGKWNENCSAKRQTKDWLRTTLRTIRSTKNAIARNEIQRAIRCSTKEHEQSAIAVVRSKLGVISKVRTSWTNERTFIWHFTPSPRLQTKVWSTMGEMYGRCFNSPGLLQRSSLTTHKGVHRTLVIDRKYRFPMKSSFFITSCSNNAVCLTHAGTLPWRFSVHCEKNKETISISPKDWIRFLLFFSACSKADGQCRSIRCRTGASTHAPSALEIRQRPWTLF